MKILLAVDGSPCSDAALEEVARRPWPEGSEINVLSAFELPLPPTPDAWAIPPDYFEELDRSAKEHARSIVDRAVAILSPKLDKSITITRTVAPGSPRVVILNEAEDWAADLIVVGSHGYGTFKRFLLGSVSLAVVSHAKCSVEVVRCPEGAHTVEPADSGSAK